VFIPKYLKKAIFGQIRKELGGVFRRTGGHQRQRCRQGRVYIHRWAYAVLHQGDPGPDGQWPLPKYREMLFVK
jgi:hypothetical protein